VLSTRSTAYRTLGLADKSPSEDELLDLMVAEPTLLRRPLVITLAGESVVGFRADALRDLIGES
jgi:arsenate reductase